jgi:hypothetical protein
MLSASADMHVMLGLHLIPHALSSGILQVAFLQAAMLLLG